VRLGTFVLLSVVFCGFFSVLLSLHASREATTQPATFAEVSALVEAAPERLDNQADQATGVDPHLIALRRSTAKKALDCLDSLERTFPALAQHEAEYGEDLVRLSREFQSTLPPLRAAYKDVLAGNTSPELQKRIQTLNEAYLTKCELFQEGIAHWKNDLARKHLEAAENLGFEGITFSTTLGEIKRRLPGETAFTKEWGQTRYVFIDIPIADSVHLSFIDDDLFQIDVGYYCDETVHTLGGFDGIENRLIKKLGPAHVTHVPNHPRVIIRGWRFPEVQRTIQLKWDDERWPQGIWLSIIHTDRYERNERKKLAYYQKEQREAEARNAGF
jgi:hypothetical protein